MKKRWIITLVPPLTAVLIVAVCVAFKQQLSIVFLQYGWGCPFNKLTGLWCVGCGNTRAVFALLGFDIPLSLWYNPTIVLLVLSAVIYWLECTFAVWGKTVHIFPRSKAFYIVFFAILALYFLVRNFIPGMLPPVYTTMPK